MTDIVAQVDTSTTTTASVEEEISTTSETQLASPANVDSINDIADIDTVTNGLTTGSILIYRTTTNKWTASTTLENQNMEGGEF